MRGFEYTNDDLDPREDVCQFADCDASDVDLFKCAKCSAKACEACITTLGPEKYCLACAVCEAPGCKQGAIVACDVCYNLTCGDHLRKHPLKTECRQCNPRPDHKEKAA
jgi:hypothetical protein